MVTKFLNIDTDNTLSANSNERVPSQKAVKTYTDNLTTSKQDKVLDTPITVESTEETTVEGALGAINTSLSNKQNQSLSSAITVDGTQQTTVEGTLNALNIYANSKQNNLTAGDNITINNNVISAKDTTYIAGTGISIDEDSDENLVISNTQTSAEWGNITGTLSDQTDLQNALNAKQDTLVSGTNIKTVNGNSLLGSGNVNINALPSQTGQSGKFLTTDGTAASWANVTSSFPLFYHTFADHLFNNASWLRADTFSWQSGAVYVSAYNHLVNDLMTNVETLYCWNRPTKEVYTTKENPSIGDSVYIINNGIVEFASTIDNISGNVIYPSGMQAYTRYSYGDINNQEVPITAETETISGTTITFYRATDGHKIVLANQESNVSAIFNSTGVAWYYILDTTNQRFKLPRSKWNFVGLRDNVGNYVTESLPNITGSFATGDGTYAVGAFSNTGTHSGNTTAGGTKDQEISFDASSSSEAYQNDAPVQQRATQAYLYFYVGNTVQDQTTIDVGQITETLNGKADTNLSNVTGTSGFRKLVEVYSNGASWYKVFDEYDPVTGTFIGKWCEQGGNTVFTNYSTTVSLLKTYADTNYTLITVPYGWSITPSQWIAGGIKSTNQFVIRSTTSSAMTAAWRTEGYLAIQ